MAFDNPTFDNQDDVDFKLHIATLYNSGNHGVDCRSKEGAFGKLASTRFYVISRVGASCWCMYATALGGSVRCITRNDGESAIKCEVCRDDTKDLFIRLTRVIIFSSILSFSSGSMVASGRKTARVIPKASCYRLISSITQALRSTLGHICCLGVFIDIFQLWEVTPLVRYGYCLRKSRFR
jgi:hypothetical protein